MKAASPALFGQGDLAEIDSRTLADAFAEVPHTEVFLKAESAGDSGDSVMRGRAGCQRWPTCSRSRASWPVSSAARRLIAEGGAYLNNQRVTSEDAVPDRGDLLPGGWLVLRRGKRHVGAVEVRPA